MSKIYQDKFSITDTEEEMFNEWLDYRLYDVHTAHPARVVSVDTFSGGNTIPAFNGKRRTVSVQLCIQRDIKGLAHAVSPLINVPVCYPSSKSFGMTWPLEEGDEGMVIFSESSMDRWWEKEGSDFVVNPEDTRMHSYSDGVFIPNIMRKSVAEGCPEIKDNELIIYNKDTTICLKEDNVTVSVGELTLTLCDDGKFSINTPTGEFVEVLARALEVISAVPLNAAAAPFAAQIRTMVK